MFVETSWFLFFCFSEGGSYTSKQHRVHLEAEPGGEREEGRRVAQDPGSGSAALGSGRGVAAGVRLRRQREALLRTCRAQLPAQTPHRRGAQAHRNSPVRRPGCVGSGTLQANPPAHRHIGGDAASRTGRSRHCSCDGTVEQAGEGAAGKQAAAFIHAGGIFRGGRQ